VQREEARSPGTGAENGEAALPVEAGAQPSLSGNGFGALHQQLAEQREALTRLREQVAGLRSEYARIGQDLETARGKISSSNAASGETAAVDVWPSEDVVPGATEHPDDQQEQPAPLLADAQPEQTPEQTLEQEPQQPAPSQPESPPQERKRGFLSWGRR